MRSGFIVQSNATSVLCIVIIELAEVVGDELLGGAAAAAAVGHFPADACDAQFFWRQLNALFAQRPRSRLRWRRLEVA